MKTQLKYVITDDVWNMLMDALHGMEWAMQRLTDTVEMREERYHPESSMAILNEDEDDDEEVVA